jgi:hypothetical protein
MTGSGRESQARSSAAPAAHTSTLTSFGAGKKPQYKKPAAPYTRATEPIGVAAGNGTARGQKDSEFEEF